MNNSEKGKERVVVLGASARPEKYSYRAVQTLLEYGHQPIPVHPSGKEVCGTTTLKTLSEIKDPIDTITLYVGPTLSNQMSSEILGASPKRIIMNPGAENPDLMKKAGRRGLR